MTIPNKINLGSGKDYREGYINIDTDRRWKPDVVLDISAHDVYYPPELNSGEFDEILANDVLEHITDLTRAMTQCLMLLRVGGVMNITVPYDLSLGAWSDPTHVRAFNERSWIYYTDWFWYLGWETHRFKLNKLEYMIDESLPPLRQTCAMVVQLEKVELTDEEKKAAQEYYGH